jgi:hypothetical protein
LPALNLSWIGNAVVDNAIRHAMSLQGASDTESPALLIRHP